MKTVHAVPVGRGNHQVHAYTHDGTPGSLYQARNNCPQDNARLEDLRIISDNDARQRCRICFPPAEEAAPGLAIDARQTGPSQWPIRWIPHGYTGTCVFTATIEAHTRRQAEEGLQFITGGKAVILPEAAR